MSEGERVAGLVKWFNTEKGYGFIVADGYNRDVFVHKEQMNKSKVQSLAEEDRVLCIVNEGKKGFYATDIVKIERPS